MIDFEPFDDDPGFTLAQAPAYAPPAYRRPRSGWWTTTEAEEHFHDVPPFRSGGERAVWMVRQMCEQALAVNDVADDAPIFDIDGQPATMDDLIAAVDDDQVSLALRIAKNGSTNAS